MVFVFASVAKSFSSLLRKPVTAQSGFQIVTEGAEVVVLFATGAILLRTAADATIGSLLPKKKK